MVKKIMLCLLLFFMFSPIVAQTKWDKENSFKVQNKLLELGFDPKGVDGVWGKNSQKALDQFFNIYQIEPSSEVELVLNILEGIKEDDSHLDEVMTKKDAIRFEKRIGFGSPVDRVVRYIGLTRREAIDLVIDELKNYEDDFDWPEWTEGSVPIGFLTKVKSTLIGKRCTNFPFKFSLQKALLKSIMFSKNPQFEKLNIFWLDHFSVAWDTYNMPYSYVDHFKFIRTNSNKNFLELLKFSFTDPAMIKYLNNDQSLPKNPNENLAREFLELFSLGEGNYSEKDIREIAKMLTGFSVNEASEKFQMIKEYRINKNFEVFNYKINNIEELIEITEKHQKFGFYIAKKLYQEYVSLEEPDQKILHQIVQKFRKHSFNISEMLRVILSTKRFWDEDNKLTLVKSPIDLLIGTMRNLGHLGINSINHKSWDKFLKSSLFTLKTNNQDLFDPPSIDGWPSGMEWLTGQKIEKRISSTIKFFESFDVINKKNTYFEQEDETLLKGILDEINYDKSLKTFFDNSYENQFVFETMMLHELDEYMDKKTEGSIKFSIHNAKLGKKRWKSIYFEIIKNRKNRPYIIINRRNSFPDIQESIMHIHKSGDGRPIYIPIRNNSKNLKLSISDKLLLERIIQSFKIILDLEKYFGLSVYSSHGARDFLKSILKKEGFKKIKSDHGLVVPVKMFAILMHDPNGLTLNTVNCKTMKCGFEEFKYQELADNQLQLEALLNKSNLGKKYYNMLENSGFRLSELLLPDFNLSLPNTDFLAMITHEGYQLK